LGPDGPLPKIIMPNLDQDQEKKLLKLPRKNKKVIGWILGDIKGINPIVVRHMIHLEDDVRPYQDHQGRLNLTL